MKKVFAIILVITILLCLTGCGKNTLDKDLLGVWYGKDLSTREYEFLENGSVIMPDGTKGSYEASNGNLVIIRDNAGTQEHYHYAIEYGANASLEMLQELIIWKTGEENSKTWYCRIYE